MGPSEEISFFLQLSQFSGFFLNLEERHLEVCPSIPMSKISAEMIGSFPGIDILELGHPIIEGLDVIAPL